MQGEVFSIHWFAYFQPDLRSVQLRWSNLESMSSLLENDNVKCKKSGMPLMGIRTLLFHQNEVVSTRQIEESESNCKVFNVIHVLGVNTNKEGGWKRFMVDYKPSVCNHFNLSQNVDYSFMNAVSIFCPSLCLVLAAVALNSNRNTWTVHLWHCWWFGMRLPYMVRPFHLTLLVGTAYK